MFDPYLEWLKIPFEHRPPTHYELLGLPAFESDMMRIHNAAMERMAAVRRYQLGEHAETVFRLLGELSRAFDDLSDPDRRRAYDEQLRATAPTIEMARTVHSPPRAERRLRRSWGLWLAGGTLAVAVAVVLLRSSALPPAANMQHTTIAAVGTPRTAVETPAVDPAGAAMPVRSAPEAAPAWPTPRQPRAGRDPRIRYFGYATAGPAAKIDKIAPYTNIVLVRDWYRSHETIAAAEAAGLPIVLCIEGKEVQRLSSQLEKVMSRHAKAVVAICWFEPYHSGYKPIDVANVGKRVKQSHPTIQYWVASFDLTTDREGPQVMPEVVDVLVIHELMDDTPELVKAKADRVLSDWRQRAAGRPILWYWGSRTQRPKGLVPTTAKGTFRACVEVAQQHQLAGVVFDRWGTVKGQERLPINSRAYLDEEIREIAGELGLDTQK